MITSKIPVAILGATGGVGQRFVQLLENHPWFEIVCLAASERSSGKTYKEAVGARWMLDTAIPSNVQGKVVLEVEKDMLKIAKSVKLAFCALEMNNDLIKKIEEKYASLGIAIVSNNSAHRWTKDIPMIIPEVNPEHAQLIDVQRKNRNWGKGLISVKPNCSIQSYVSILTALQKFKPIKVHVVSLQAISGAGKTFKTWPEMIDNAIPYIQAEEEKSEKEPLKIWGFIKDNKLQFAEEPSISATCIRIPTSNGHLASVSVSFSIKVSKQQILDEVALYKSKISQLRLPSAPKQFITYFDQDDRPQVKLDRDLANGMGISMGRLRPDIHFDWKFIALSHNTIRGASGGAILLAELLVKKGYICSPR